MPKFEAHNNKEYRIKIIWDSVVYIKKANRHLLKLYYLAI